MLVEDDVECAGFIKHFYELKEANVIVANSAKEAREILQTMKFDLYVFDIAMPLEDGLSLLKSIRETDDTTKAVALTAFVDKDHEKEILEGGFDMFIKKPALPEELLSIVNLL